MRIHETDLEDTAKAAKAWWRIMSDDQRAVENFAEFSQWCDDDPAHLEMFNRISQSHSHRKNIAQPRKTFVSKPKRNALGMLGLLGTGGVAVAAAAVWLLMVLIPSGPQWKQQILQDGSMVELAPGSQYEVAFSKNSRDIILSQGSLVVRAEKDPDRPMRVITDYGQARVVGTTFSVSLIGTEFQTSVLEGLVKVSFPKASETYAVAPGQRVWRQGTNKIAITDNVPIDKVLEIKDGWMTLHHAAVRDVLDAVSRHSGHVFIISPFYHPKTSINGRFNLRNANDTLDVLKVVTGVQVSEVTDNVSLVY